MINKRIILIDNIPTLIWGPYSDKIYINPLEVEDYKWMPINEIKIDLKNNPQKYTYWFRYIIENHIKEIEENLNF